MITECKLRAGCMMNRQCRSMLILMAGSTVRQNHERGNDFEVRQVAHTIPVRSSNEAVLAMDSEDDAPINHDRPDIARSHTLGRNLAEINPIRWFGMLAPQPLRMTQKYFIDVVERDVGKLASLESQMNELEIEIRRIKKHFKTTLI